MYDLIVVGSGPGGYEAAAHAGRMGKKVALIEKGEIGGTCLNVGCIPTKTLLKSAHVFEECRSASLYGVNVSVPTVDMAKVLSRKDKVVSTLKKGVESLLKTSGVEILKGNAILERNEGKIEIRIRNTDTVVTGTNVLIASGSRPAKPPIPGIDSANVLDSTGILSLQKAPVSLVIIGGGVIGLEFAGFFSAIGTKVTVVEMLPSIAAGIDGDIANRLLQSLKRAGIVFHLSCKVAKIEEGIVHCIDSSNAQQQVVGEYMLNATGRMPALNDLGLDEAGVVYTKKGVSVDEYGKTNIPGIWACGDVTGRMQLAHAATREGIVAVNTMCGIQDRMRYTAMPGVIYTHPEVAVVGKTEEALQAEGIEYVKAIVPMGIAGRFIVENEGKSGTIKVLCDKKYGQVLGIHMIGGPCSEIIFGGSFIIEHELRAADLRQIVFPHPTVSEALKEAILHLA
ncbi:MAG: dihydrolipoyl dehydrogenase [Candidatus Raymondbacteria bacterium RifOxyA12_full_50_37]|uniref:Dihydrolipoyl dehydrogenase n=1 Tax=Candidatus Raymondbacteria bacterium RIFOXYD12_FULL_49_13 TaxID=1817890 RepID=A0A1F7F0D5_UNCRA|nr:MAG: dihydrolipoyl dehydrogenase [Candidatus Raymondbacteria bacterium RIFOXYA2_FULL_49_16]OGJ88407.1 MAG: dihydrolipoyl dehydrogenase [Candidatus Raymondbacteria bacterium RifOxyB12_full_50_8]OGJ91862.1 MAG: dihydrolipoyl dehydrogenase [Candidatus Raymondbacteria bacterium RifOxyA12_full_50_37]OGK00105.1 MAG: dihydrolipoyl dehydrogenase [Candidatus Raymondbacteria bacterium RIFOXYD12_FULL_49_13]OGK06950.1 MAG: dihydrolipoyl dehydrogenase [Candidatus Raymondbacteria bacterium RifOxyC12_full_